LKKFTEHEGIAAPLMRINIDTDAIIPSREMKRVSKHGLGEGLFAGWRYLNARERTENPDFVLNKTAYKGATILLSGVNFGCGSSREHAVWALREYGIRVIIASSFGSIFYGNCSRNGILPIVLSDKIVHDIVEQLGETAQQNQLLVNLPEQTVLCPDGRSFSFEIESGPKEMLVQGLDPIALTQRLSGSVDEFEDAYQGRRPWLY